MKYLKYFENITDIGQTKTFIARHKEIEQKMRINYSHLNYNSADYTNMNNSFLFISSCFFLVPSGI